ncbi:MAG: terminase small subunit [Alphaproteobacteria bacterium]|nr:MAG: terminase small subunit [Alphaproteobacteria bacterium]
MSKKLTAKQLRFVEEYLVDLNATAAAKRAGYSEKTAYSIGQENLNKPEIQKAIQKDVNERSKRTEITQDRVVAELAKIGFADIRNAVVWGATPNSPDVEGIEPNGLNIYPVALIPSTKIDDDTAAAVSEISLTQMGVKIKMYDKKAALDSLARHLGMFNDKIDLKATFVKDPDSFTDEELAAIAARASGSAST